MRRTLLAAAVIAGIATYSERSWAVIPVTCDNCVEFPAWITQTAKELDNMVQQVNQLQTIYGTLSGLTNVQGISSALGLPLIANPLSSVTSGSFTSGSVTGSLSALSRDFRAADNVFLPQPGTGGFTGNLLNGRADMLANIKAAATHLFDSSQARISSLQELKAQVGQAATLKEAQDLNNEISSAEADIANQQGQLQQLASLAQVQKDQSDLQEREQQYKSDKSWYDSTKALD